MDPRRTTSGNSQVGKLIFLTITDFSLSAQEIVTYSGAFHPGGVGTPNFHRMYIGGSPPIESSDSLGRPGQQVGSELANYSIQDNWCNIVTSPGFCWAYSGGWDTLLYHVTPGLGGSSDTRMEVWAAHEGETSYTKIWDLFYLTNFSSAPPNGWNALLCSVYNNGLNNSEFWHRYDQLIFSKEFIPCPQI
jgi:hypothetical protein